MRGARFAAALSAALWLPGTAFALFDDDEARRRIEVLRQQVEANSRALEERFRQIEDRRPLVELSGQIEAVRAELAKMRGQLEVLTNQIDTADKRQKDLYVDIDTRLRKLEQSKEPVATDKPPADNAVPAAETKGYEAALNQFKLGNYPLAISAFQGFLVTYPTSKLAASAQYWIGNAYFAQRDYKQAMAAQQKLLASWPDDGKAPDAMLNIATSQEALGDRRGAQKTLEALLAKYPGTPAASSAKQRLAQGPKR
ncbi:MAG TPA: tol-pal system protein YbgF [Burkholderiales bacterium]|jgi:tol-pal system protein YbgF|nr:tol-pal system protein YbgF [Burkholderiales bacterium]